MSGPGDYHTKWWKSEREWQIPHDVTYTENLNYDTNELIYETDKLADEEKTHGCQGRWEEGWTGRLGSADANY